MPLWSWAKALVKQSPVVLSVCRGPRCIAICSQPLHSAPAPREAMWNRVMRLWLLDEMQSGATGDGVNNAQQEAALADAIRTMNRWSTRLFPTERTAATL